MNSFSRLYCSSLTKYERYPTREVKIGDVPLGGANPVRIQSMTTTNTMNTIATVEQTIRMVEAGCEYVRITAPSINDAQNLLEIKKELKKRGCHVPLIADIHFTPNAAETAARIVEKVRINPGNYADRKKFQKIDYTDSEYNAELERIRERFIPLLKICKEYGTAMRIGTNHGSLSDRIMSRYGDTPLGMVESALEFVRICRDVNYHEIVLSMKASNPQVMVQAYRLLVAKMQQEDMNYPLHLGVTEAGDGEDARVKSAAGIGTLLEDGLGDTIRVSLTEDPERESPVAIKLAERYLQRNTHAPVPEIISLPYNPYAYRKRHAFTVSSFGEGNVPRVISDFSLTGISSYSDLEPVGYTYNETSDKWNISDQACDFLYLGENDSVINLPENLGTIISYKKWLETGRKDKRQYPLFTFGEYKESSIKSDDINFVLLGIENIGELKNTAFGQSVVFVIHTSNSHGMAEQRRIFIELLNLQIDNPAVIKRSYMETAGESFMLHCSTDMGALLLDGFGDGVWAETAVNGDNAPDSRKTVNRILFGILQAARLRISKTEYIACPSCGRTLFDLQIVTAKIRSRTEHLKGVKIGIMGCIVNGPGEMADADYGYVGSGPGKITLYRGQNVVRKNINSAEAVDQLIDLIREDGLWHDPGLKETGT